MWFSQITMRKSMFILGLPDGQCQKVLARRIRLWPETYFWPIKKYLYSACRLIGSRLIESVS